MNQTTSADQRGERSESLEANGRHFERFQFALTGLCIWMSGCARPLPENALVITQVSLEAQAVPVASSLDLKYPPGTRVVVAAGADFRDMRFLSTGLFAAGDPVVSYDGRRIVFAGKISLDADWQIYESDPSGGRPRPLTAVKGGAAGPALLADGTLLYISPVPGSKGTSNPALFSQALRARPRQLTFGLPVSDLTVLSDGRILFVSPGGSKSASGSALYTINNDGTEISAYACQHDPPAWLRRPRELWDGRIVFLAGREPTSAQTAAEFVLSAKPFDSRAQLLPGSNARIYSIQPVINGNWLICAQSGPGPGSRPPVGAIFLVDPASPTLGNPTLQDPIWSCIEAAAVGANRRPMGRLSNVDLTHRTGQILCLNANDSTIGAERDLSRPKAKRIRVFTKSSAGDQRLLGEVEVLADGSFMAEVPADIPLGFEAADELGTVLRREPPLIWVRPGENRACVGCHEPHNHSPRNLRPLAVRVPVPRLVLPAEKLAKNQP